MAAFEDRTGPDLDQFLGHKWTDWLNAIQSSEPKQQSSSETSSSSKRDVEVARLRRLDMGLFGFRPATDKLFLVVCEHCGQLVKPQSMNSHYERKHKSKRITKMLSPSSSRTSHSMSKHPSRVNHCIGTSSNVQKNSSHASTSLQHKSSSHSSMRHGGASDPRKSSLLKNEPAPVKITPPDKNFVEPVPLRHPRSEKGGIKLIPSQHAKHPLSSVMKQNRTSVQTKPSNKTNISLQENKRLENLSTKLTSHHLVDQKHYHRHHLHKTLKNGTQSKLQGPESSHSTERKLTESNAHSPTSSRNKRVQNAHLHHRHSSSHDSSSDSSNISSDISEARLPSPEQRILNKEISQNQPLVVIEKTPMPGGIGSVRVGPPSSQAHKRSRNSSGRFDSSPSPPRAKVPLLQNAMRDKSSIDDVPHHLPNSLLLIKPKKKEKRNIPLKAREYDPNRHCGVWLTEDNARCTRSLTCKVHPLSAKRGVPGRRKMFDELVQERTREKQKLKEKNAEMLATTTSPSVTSVLTSSSRSSGFAVPSTSPVNVRLKSDPGSTSSSNFPVPNQQMPSPVTKSKSSSVNLFPKNFAAWHVDCWDDFDEPTDESNNPRLSCVQRHPQALSVCQFSARRVGLCQVSYSRKLERQLQSLSSNVQKFVSKSHKTPKPRSFTPVASATFHEQPLPDIAETFRTFLKPNNLTQTGTLSNPQPNALLQNNNHISMQKPIMRTTGSVPDNLHKRGLPDHVQVQDGINYSGQRSGKINVQRKSSTPVIKEPFQGNEASIRNRSKSEQAVNLIRRTVSGSGDMTRGLNATWVTSHATESSISTSPHFFINDATHVNNLSPLSISSTSPSIVQISSNDFSSGSMHTITAARRDQAMLKKMNEKRKNMMAPSPKSSSFKGNTKSAIAQYAVPQGLVKSLQSEHHDSGQTTVQLPNGLNSVSGNILLKPGSHSVTLSGNIGALTVAGDDAGSLTSFTEHQISKRLKNMNSNNNFISQMETSSHHVGYNSSSPKSKLIIQQQQPTSLAQVALVQGMSGMPENIILQGDDHYLISPPHGQDGGSGTKTIVLDQYPGTNSNLIESANMDHQQDQSNSSTDIFRLVCAPGESPINCEVFHGKINDKHNLPLNMTDVTQLDQSIIGNVLMNVNNPVTSSHLVTTDTSNFNLLHNNQATDLTSCSSSAKTNRTSEIGQNFVTQ